MKAPDSFRSEGRRRLIVDEPRGCVELGRLMGIPHQTVSMLRSGRIEPSLGVVIAIERVCGIPPRTWREPPRTIANGHCGTSSDPGAKQEKTPDAA